MPTCRSHCAHIRKPFDQGMLLGTIEELLSALPELAVEAVERRVREVPLAVTLAWCDGARVKRLISLTLESSLRASRSWSTL